MRKKIAILGGTFNPVHNGHLRLALDLVQQVGFDEMRLVPCHIPTHRATPDVDSVCRAKMVELGIAGNPSLQMDDRELVRGSTSYSVDTLIQLRDEYGADCSLSLVMGLDAYLGLTRWHRWRELLQLAHLLVIDRPGYQLPAVGELAEFDARHRADVEVLALAPAGAVTHLNIRALDISATEIRALTAAGQSTRYLLPESVRRYIAEQQLYRARD
ncbi:nicotinate-nucleotide adenylyltransferase [Gilvimarinus polysaccharolyticus]|uniref:nicotinate-nucleotide adenylyltransferase n=1 Tax=Gilvimarinus polysaccharolyticus TaxID=863921 RepID=UPI00067384B2|nr:nicotinate-nucleotide adenylyltransferase [Gilvimarinus polysaccharolyticus]